MLYIFTVQLLINQELVLLYQTGTRLPLYIVHLHFNYVWWTYITVIFDECHSSKHTSYTTSEQTLPTPRNMKDFSMTKSAKF